MEPSRGLVGPCGGIGSSSFGGGWVLETGFWVLETGFWVPSGLLLCALLCILGLVVSGIAGVRPDYLDILCMNGCFYAR